MFLGSWIWRIEREILMKNKDNRYGFMFDFGDGGWNIIMFDSNENYHVYYASDEDDIKQSIQHLEDYVTDSKNIYKYRIPTYDEFDEKIEDIFSLKNKPIEVFTDYLSAY